MLGKLVIELIILEVFILLFSVESFIDKIFFFNERSVSIKGIFFRDVFFEFDFGVFGFFFFELVFFL